MAVSSHDSGESDPASWLLNRQRAVRVDLPRLRHFAALLRRRVAAGREFAVAIDSDAAVRHANRRYRGRDRVTDVLAFPDAGRRLGDILIAASRARRQARFLGHPLERELQVLMLHGLLHLLGYDHERDRGRMLRAERNWRRRLRLPVGLIERSRRTRR